jgi:transcriptional regulator with XRE-family HTH domain
VAGESDPVGGIHVGLIIKKLRSERRISLQELSRLSGVSAGMLSQVERNLANPSLRVLTKIQNALGTTASALFPEPVEGRRPDKDPDFVQRRDERRLCELGYLTKELLSTGASQSLEMMLLHIPPNGSSGVAPLTSLSEKGGIVLSGEIVMSVGGKEARLGEGDSFIFDGRTPHAFRNIGTSPAKVLWVISNFPMERHL